MAMKKKPARPKRKGIVSKIKTAIKRRRRPGVVSKVKKVVRDKDGNKVNQVYDRERHNLTFNFHRFYKQWYKKQFNENILQWTGERVSTDVIMRMELASKAYTTTP